MRITGTLFRPSTALLGATCSFLLALALPAACSDSGGGDDDDDASGGGGGSDGDGAGGDGGEPEGGQGGAPSTGGGGGTGGSGGGSGGSVTGGNGGGGGSGGAMNMGGGGGGGGMSGAMGGGGGAANGNEMSFFVTSAGKGNGGDLDGLAGADAHCRMLATAVNAKRKMWFAYLGAANGNQPVHPKDRIGTGPWYNQKKQMFSMNLTTLHPTINPTMNRQGYIAVKPADALFMDEKGMMVPSNQHDILTGANADGTASTANTCDDWNSSAGDDKAIVGHSDTPGSTQFSPSWNAAHDTVSCSQSGVSQRGGNGRFYCFAVD